MTHPTADLEEILSTLRWFGLELNPANGGGKAIKGQALANFLVEMEEEVVSPDRSQGMTS